MRHLIQVGVGALAVAGSLLVASPATAATQHCDSTTYPNKVETSGDSATVHTSLAPHTPVCVKAGNEVMYTWVDWYGNITNNVITNGNGNYKGISYYAWDTYTPPS